MSEDHCTTPLKRCTKCGEEKPLTLDYFPKRHEAPDGYRNECKLCVNKRGRERATNRDYSHIDYTVPKQCNACREYFPRTIEYFYPNNKTTDGLTTICRPCHLARKREYYTQNTDKMTERRRQWRIDNPEGDKAIARRWRLNHPEQAREGRRRWYVNNIDRCRDNGRRWKANNPDKVRESSRKFRVMHPDRMREYRRAWEKANPEKAKIKARLSSHHYRTAGYGVSDRFTSRHWQLSLKYFDNCCAVCGRRKSFWHTIAQDHWVPIAKGGATSIGNMVPLCHAKMDGRDGCNNHKQARDASEWLIATYGKRKANQILARIDAYFEWIKAQDIDL